jgi:hypothetical protein
MYIQHLVSIICCSVFLVSSGPASQNPIPQTPADDTGKIRGVVIDHTGAVVANFTVEIRKGEDSAAKSGVAPHILAKQTDKDGQFSFNLAAGSYEVCAKRFPASCHRVRVKEGESKLEPLVLKIDPADDPAPSELLDRRLQRIAGPGAHNCGHVRVNENPTNATACALVALKHRRPFYVRYDESGIDSEVADGIAGDSTGDVYSVGFDSMAINPGWMPAGASMPDGFHTKVIPCSKPVRVRKNHHGKLVCFGDGRWLRD